MPEEPARIIIIIGGGAAGYMAAISAKTHAPMVEVQLLEKSDKWLAKVRISGGGRCNVTHHCAEPRKLARHYPRGEAFVRKVFTAWGQPQAVEWFAHNPRSRVFASTRSDIRLQRHPPVLRSRVSRVPCDHPPPAVT